MEEQQQKTGYDCYLTLEGLKILREHPTWSYDLISGIVGEKWNRLGSLDRLAYDRRAAALCYWGKPERNDAFFSFLRVRVMSNRKYMEGGWTELEQLERAVTDSLRAANYYYDSWAGYEEQLRDAKGRYLKEPRARRRKASPSRTTRVLMRHFPELKQRIEDEERVRWKHSAGSIIRPEDMRFTTIPPRTAPGQSPAATARPMPPEFNHGDMGQASTPMSNHRARMGGPSRPKSYIRSGDKYVEVIDLTLDDD